MYKFDSEEILRNPDTATDKTREGIAATQTTQYRELNRMTSGQDWSHHWTLLKDCLAPVNSSTRKLKIFPDCSADFDDVYFDELDRNTSLEKVPKTCAQLSILAVLPDVS
jgi:hypothetical protein